MSALPVWAVLSNHEVGESVSRVVWSQGPFDTGFVFPLKGDSVVAWVADPDIMPVIGVAGFDVLRALELETGLPDTWHVEFLVRRPVDDILIRLITWTRHA